MVTHPSLIAVDLDGTLLDPSGAVSARSAAALDAAARRGITVVLATGRPVQLVTDVLRAAPGATSHVIGTNGSMIADVVDDEAHLVHLVGFPAELARAAVIHLRRRDPRFAFALATDAGFGHEPGFVERMPANIAPAPVDDVLTLGGDEAFKLITYHPDHGVDELLDLLRADRTLTSGLGTPLSVSHLGADAAEIGAAGIDKGTGLAWLCARLSIEPDDVVAFGDEANDIEMLRWAGHGVAVANAPPAVRQAADEVAPTNVADGVAQVIERMLGR